MREATRPWATGCAVVMSVLAMTGCAPDAPTAEAPARPTARPATTRADSADCTKATKVAILASGSAFSPAALTIRRGAFLAVTNKSSAAHPLRSTPDAGIVTSVVDRKERQVIQFPRAGTFTVRSGDAVLRLTVAGESGCGAPGTTLTMTGAGRFSPGTARVAATANFAVVNDTGVTQSVTCTPGRSKDHTRLDAGETEILAIDEPGSYVCASLQHPAVRVAVTVTPSS